jgi:glyceraldehyde 3-phosphate dehydrogenase
MDTETHFQDWTAREQIAERMIPLLGKLYREHGVISTVYGKPLVHCDPVAIIKAHKYARKFDGGGALNMVESEAVMELMCSLKLAPARVDIGKLVSGLRDSDQGLEVFVRLQLSSIIDRQSTVLSEPRDVVLYGFGRIGRLLARMLVNKVGGGDKAVLRAIVVRPKGDDLARRASLLRRDSVHGPFQGSIDLDHDHNALIINGTLVKLIYANSPDEVDYTAHGIHNAVVIDNTGKWRDSAGLGLHLKAKGASKVILTAPGKGDIPNIVFGVNHEVITDQTQIISAASCTTNAVVPPLKVIEDEFGIVSGHLETVHAYTNDQNLTDNFHPKARRNRGAAMNLVITSTGAASAAAKALPSLEGKLTGSAIRVPIPNVSLAVINLQLARETTREALNEHLRQVSMGGALQDQIDWTQAPDVVSIDQVGNPHAAIVDATATIVKGKTAVIYVWYDNEYGYSAQVLRLLGHSIGMRRPHLPSASVLD